jgi:uncharacterized membrane protein YkvA (DUF1232 family)
VVVASDTPADPFPRERFLSLVRRLPAYGRLAWRLAHDDRLKPARRSAMLAALAYVASPVDLVPGVIPVAGQLDDAAVALLALRFALDGLPVSARQAHLQAAGLGAADLDDDLATVRATAGWMVRQGVRASRRIGRDLRSWATTGSQVFARELVRTRQRLADR